MPFSASTFLTGHTEPGLAGGHSPHSRRRSDEMRWFVILVASAMLVPGVVGQDRPVTSGGWSVHVVRAGESLSSVGARHGVEPRVLAHGNAVRSDAALRVGQRLIIDNRHLVPSAER